MFNSFTKIPGKKTAFIIDNWQVPIFGDRMYLVLPRYVVGRKSPDFSMVVKGKHLSGFYRIGSTGVYSGDHKGKLLIGLASNDMEKFEVILTNIPVLVGRSQLINGELNRLIGQARKNSNLVQR